MRQELQVTARMKAGDSPNSVKPMTGAMLRALCAEAGVVRSGKEPSRAAYEDLAQTINDFRRLVSLSTVRRESSRRMHRFMDAVLTLNTELPAIREDCREALAQPSRSRKIGVGRLGQDLHEPAEDGGMAVGHAAHLKLPVMLDLCQEDLVTLDALVAAVAATRKLLLKILNLLGQPIERWHDFALDLAEAFREAMHSTNPGLELRPSNNGPVVRFLKAVVPKITGEDPTLNSIARYLQRWEQLDNRR
jgi:hypothetical protein